MNPAVLLADAFDKPRHIPVGQRADKIDPRSHERVSNQIATGFHSVIAPFTCWKSDRTRPLCFLYPNVVTAQQRCCRYSQSAVGEESHQSESDDADKDPFRQQEEPRIVNQ